MPPSHGLGRRSRLSRDGPQPLFKTQGFFYAVYVYILKSLRDGTYYKGSSEDYIKRFEDHNAGESFYTSTKGQWELIYVEEQPDKRSMLIRAGNTNDV